MKKHTWSKHQSGFGLAVALVIVGFMAGLLSIYYSSQSGTVLRKEAEISGWEGAEIARAARIYARNQIRDIPDLVVQLSIPAAGFGGTGPERIGPDSLILNNLLPAGFARNNGTNFTNALGQRVDVYLANHPVDGNPNDPSTVPTAYVVFNDNAKTNARVMQDVVTALRQQNVAISAPIYNGAVNITGACNGGEQTVAMWDSGCLDENDYDLMVDGSNDGDSFVQGSMIIPAWRSVSFDGRAMMRFPQPERPDTSTMLTHLKMGDSLDCDPDNDGVYDVNLVTLPEEGGSFDSNICDANDDDSGMGINGDFRRDIKNVGNVNDTFALILDPQTANDVYVDNLGAMGAPTLDESYAMSVGGQLNGDGDVAVYLGDTNINGNLTTDKNIRVTSSNPSPGSPASARVGTLNANNTASDNLDVANRVNTGVEIAIQNSLTEVSTLNAIGEYTADVITLNGTGTNIASGAGATYGDRVRVNGTARIGGNFESSNIRVTSTQDVAPSLSGYSFATAVLSTNDVEINSLSVNDRINMFSDTNTERIDVTNSDKNAQCIGDCPRRAITEQCNNMRDSLPDGFPGFGYESYEACLNR